jgi:hypothetical protein
MTWDLRPRYAFDATEGQIPEGQVSVYGPANSHANCVPASFAAALELAGFPDIDPQRITNEVFGPGYRGGFGNFSRAIAWIKANVASAPSFTDGPFDFATADAAGAAGKLVIVAGWIDPASVTFTPAGSGFSHASLLAAHLANDTFVIWNTWTGQLQTYNRATLAASLYEMAVMTNSGDDMSIPNDQWYTLLQGIYGVKMQADGTVIKDAAGTPIPTPAMATVLKSQADQTAAIIAAITGLHVPAPIIDSAAIAASVVAQMPAPVAPAKAVAPQPVRDALATVLKWLGLA